MNVKFNTLFYTALFSGLGVFSFLLLINYAAFPDKVADILHSVGTLAFFVLAFNVLGYATIRLSTWVDNQYALNLHRRWKLISVYVVVMGMFFLLNYGLLVTAKLLAGDVTHGQSLAVFYPAFTRYTYPAAEHKFATVGRIFEPSLERESDAVAAERSCDAIDCFLKRIGLWINFRELNVTKEDIREIADCGQVLGDYANNPRVATIPEMYELLMSCYDRK